MSSRRNTLIRTVAAVCGDIAVGAALASACVWLIEAAALGLFLSFLLWLVGLMLSLALSQYVVHPLCAAVLSDRKLDGAVRFLTSFTTARRSTGAEVVDELASRARSAFARAGTRQRVAATP